jgi:signal transduction histidine kinase
MMRLRLRTVLASVFLLILALPLTGFLALRIYESALVRQTESELIGQGAILSAAYAALLDRHAGKNFDWTQYGVPLPVQSKNNEYSSADSDYVAPARDYEPHPAKLDLARDRALPPAPDPLPASEPADALARVTGGELKPILDQAQQVTLAGLRVIAPNGVIVASTGEGLGLSLLQQQEVQRALSGEFLTLLRERKPSNTPPPGIASISRNTALRVFVAMPISHRNRVIGAVLLTRTPSNLTKVVWARRVKIAQITGLLLLATLALAWLTATTITQPLRRLAQQAQRAHAGERNAVQPARRRVVKEVAELSETVAGMADALQARAAYIKDFAAHVSHEFKTPLTAIGGAAELLKEHGGAMSETERAGFLNIISKDTARLDQLTRRLLELARADMATPGKGNCNLASVLRTAVHRAREGGQLIELIESLPEEVSLPMSAELFDSILSGLFDNARQHAAGAVVTLQCEQEKGQLNLLVSDNGPGISTGNADQIFTPFFTTARAQGNTGLGLAIIRALLVAHGGNIALLPQDSGTTFRLSWVL